MRNHLLSRERKRDQRSGYPNLDGQAFNPWSKRKHDVPSRAPAPPRSCIAKVAEGMFDEACVAIAGIASVIQVKYETKAIPQTGRHRLKADHNTRHPAATIAIAVKEPMS